MKTDFYLRRFHSLLGVIPLFIFVPVHMLQKAIPFFTFIFKNSSVFLLIAFGIVPFALHVLLGIYIYVQNRSPAVKKHPGVLFRLQMVSSFVILLFVAFHVYLFSLLEHSASYPLLVTSYIVFILGIAALAFHIGYGAFTFCVTWGICAGTRARKITRIVTAALGTVFGIGGITLYILVFDRIKGMLSL